MIAKHHKVHLFDIDVPGKIKFKVKKKAINWRLVADYNIFV
jgi:hypothetical protein